MKMVTKMCAERERSEIIGGPEAGERGNCLHIIGRSGYRNRDETSQIRLNWGVRHNSVKVKIRTLCRAMHSFLTQNDTIYSKNGCLGGLIVRK